MAIVAALPTIAKIAAPFVLPYVMSLIARGVSGPLANAMGSQTPAINPRTGKPYVTPSAVARHGTVTTPNRALQGVGGVLSTVGDAGKAAIPFLLNTAGRGIQAAGITGGALTQAAGNAPSHIANAMHTQRQKELYGSTPMDAAAGILGNVGEAAGVGISTAGNAIGSSLQDIGNAIRLYNLQNTVFSNIGKLRGITPSQASALETMRKAGSGVR